MAKNRIEMAGKKYNKLTALSFIRCDRVKGAMWMFRCDCGVEKEYGGYIVRKGLVVSCGCVARTGKPFPRPSVAGETHPSVPSYADGIEAMRKSILALCALLPGYCTPAFEQIIHNIKLPALDRTA